MGYEYRWDFDSDGEFDTEWSKDGRDVTFAYDADQAKGVELVLTEAAGRYKGAYKVRLSPGEQADLNPRYLGDGWRINPHESTPPHVMLRGNELLVRAGASELRVNGVAMQGDEVPVPYGSVLQFGEHAKMRVDAVVESTLEVRSVFGNVQRTRTDVVIQSRAGEKTAARAIKGAGHTLATKGAAP
jgi:hypothetical protein